MFDGIWNVIGTPIQSNAYAAGIVAKSNKELGEKLEAISKEEIKSKDRVDISLEEYQRLHRHIENLERQNDHMGKLIVQLGIPAEIINSIKPDTVNVTYCDDIIDFVRHYRVAFDVDDSPDIRRWMHEY
jgi:hypothetical protein